MTGTGPLAGQGRDGPFRAHDHEPPPAFGHVSYVGKIIRWLNELLPDGRALPETPVLTADGVKVTDVTWISAAYAQELEARKPWCWSAPRKSASKFSHRPTRQPKWTRIAPSTLRPARTKSGSVALIVKWNSIPETFPGSALHFQVNYER